MHRWSVRFFGEKQDKMPAQSLHRDVRHLIGLSVPDRSVKEGGKSKSGKHEVGSFRLFLPFFLTLCRIFFVTDRPLPKSLSFGNGLIWARVQHDGGGSDEKVHVHVIDSTGQKIKKKERKKYKCFCFNDAFKWVWWGDKVDIPTRKERRTIEFASMCRRPERHCWYANGFLCLSALVHVFLCWLVN